jgi:hypothetical protein
MYTLHRYCTFCKKEFDVRNAGISQINQHSKGSKHLNYSKCCLSSEQSRFSIAPTEDGDSELVLSSAPNWRMSELDVQTQAEVLWSMQVSSYGYSYSSCEDVALVFQKMFPDSKIASIASHSSCSYRVL